MFPRKYKKLSSFKRFILKLLNVYALDKETLNLVNPNYKNYEFEKKGISHVSHRWYSESGEICEEDKFF